MNKQITLSSLIMVFATLLFVISDSVINYLAPLGFQFYHYLFYGAPVFLVVPIYLILNGNFKKHMVATNYYIPIFRGLIFIPLPFLGFLALKYISLPEFTTLLLSLSVFHVIISVVFLKEEINYIIILSLVIGMLGVILVMQPGFENFTFYYCIVLLIAFLLSISNVIINKYHNTCSSVGYFIYGGIFSYSISIILFFFDPLVINLNIFILIFIGSICYNLALVLIVIAYKKSQKYFGAISCLIYIQIFWSLIFGLIFFNEVLNIFAATGALLIIISGILAIPAQYRQVDKFDQNKY